MKRAKQIGVAVALLAGMTVLAVAGRFYGFLPRIAPPAPLRAVSDPAIVARGAYLANHVAACMSCHSDADKNSPGDEIIGALGAGKSFEGEEGLPGSIRAANLTPDPSHGLGSWSDGEIVRAMREGVSKSGRALFPLMPYQTYAAVLSDEDALAIVSYLRTLPSSPNDPGTTTLPFPLSMLVRGAPRPVETQVRPSPPETDVVARGDWLLRMGSCDGCHTPIDNRGRQIPTLSFAGGMRFRAPPPFGTVIAPNITADPTTGVGATTDDALLRVFDEGTGKAGRPLYAMPWKAYRGLTANDKRALVAAIRRIPAVANEVASH